MRWLILLTYLVQFIVISRFPVSSEASTLQLLRRNPFQLPGLSLLLLAGLGVLGIVTFHLPLIFALFPALSPPGGVTFGQAGGALLPVLTGFLLLSGTALTVLGVKSLRERPPVSSEAPRPLRMDGVYGFCRHPVSLGLMGVTAGFFVAYPLWIMAPGTVALFLNLHQRARLEEAFLTAEYGALYPNYRARVPMYGLPLRMK